MSFHKFDKYLVFHCRREKEIKKSVGEEEEDEEDKGGLKLSMTERIFQMENLIEETSSKSCPITPRSKSGTVTPKLKTRLV